MRLLIFTILILLLGCNLDNSDTSSNDLSPSVEKGISQEFRNGDLIFHTSTSSQSKAIQIATNSKYSHMGIIYQEGQEYYVYEAVQPVKLTKLNDWINRGVNGSYVVKRLGNIDNHLSDIEVAKMKKVGKTYLNKDYDLLFEWSDDKIYCSELVWKIYKESFNIEIGKLEKFSDFDLSNEIVKAKIEERYGSEMPKNELVITPDQMFNAENLVTVLVK